MFFLKSVLYTLQAATNALHLICTGVTLKGVSICLQRISEIVAEKGYLFRF